MMPAGRVDLDEFVEELADDLTGTSDADSSSWEVEDPGDDPTAMVHAEYLDALRQLEASLEGVAELPPDEAATVWASVIRRLLWHAGHCGELELRLEQVWFDFGCCLPAEGPYPSWRWRGLLALADQEGELVFRHLGPRPNVGIATASQFYGEGFGPASFDFEADPYPQRRADETSCPCCDCNTPAETGYFTNPRSPGFDLEEFCEAEQRGFFDLFPRPLLAWALDAWEFEARLDGRFVAEGGLRRLQRGPDDREYSAEDLAERRALQLRGARESLRWKSPGRRCRKAWVIAVVRAGLGRAEPPRTGAR